jgi:hypothetical protein
MPGLVPNVIIGSIFDASITSVRSNFAPSSLRSSRQRATAASHAAPRGACLRPSSHAGARARFDRHVAHRHPALHVERADRGTGVLDDVAGRAADADLGDHREHEVLGRRAGAQLALEADLERLRLALEQTLRREHVLDLARADAERERAERAVRRRVAVAAHDRHARLGVAELGTDHVDDAGVLGVGVVQRDSVLAAVLGQRAQLRACGVVEDGEALRQGGDRVIHRRDRPVGAADPQAARAEARERLRRGHLVNEVEIDVQHGRPSRLLGDDVRVPDLLEQRALHDASALCQLCNDVRMNCAATIRLRARR